MSRNHAGIHPYRFAIGAAVLGAAAGLLFAPKSGKKVRRDLIWQIEKTRVRAGERRAQIQSAAHVASPKIRASLRRAGDESRGLLREAGIRARHIGDDFAKTASSVRADLRHYVIGPPVMQDTDTTHIR